MSSAFISPNTRRCADLHMLIGPIHRPDKHSFCQGSSVTVSIPPPRRSLQFKHARTPSHVGAELDVVHTMRQYPLQETQRHTSDGASQSSFGPPATSSAQNIPVRKDSDRTANRSRARSSHRSRAGCWSVFDFRNLPSTFSADISSPRTCRGRKVCVY